MKIKKSTKKGQAKKEEPKKKVAKAERSTARPKPAKTFTERKKKPRSKKILMSELAESKEVAPAVPPAPPKPVPVVNRIIPPMPRRNDRKQVNFLLAGSKK